VSPTQSRSSPPQLPFLPPGALTCMPQWPVPPHPSFQGLSSRPSPSPPAAAGQMMVQRLPVATRPGFSGTPNQASSAFAYFGGPFMPVMIPYPANGAVHGMAPNQAAFVPVAMAGHQFPGMFAHPGMTAADCAKFGSAAMFQMQPQAMPFHAMGMMSQAQQQQSSASAQPLSPQDRRKRRRGDRRDRPHRFKGVRQRPWGKVSFSPCLLALVRLNDSSARMPLSTSGLAATASHTSSPFVHLLCSGLPRYATLSKA
jgi:hypothetical protein